MINSSRNSVLYGLFPKLICFGSSIPGLTQFKGGLRGEFNNRKINPTVDIGAYEYEFTDCDGTPPYMYKNSPNGSIKTENGSGKPVIFPNPADQWYSIQFFSEFDEPLNLSMFNSIGKFVFYKQVNIKKGENHFTFSREQLNPGIYYLISESQNQKFNTMKLILK